MADWFREQALSGSLVLAMPVALVAGLVSFFSPCVIPLLPGYLSYATGLSGADLQDAEVTRQRRGRMLAGSLLFVLGFSTVFVLIGVASGAAGAWLVRWQDTLTVVLGVLSILLGLAFLGAVPFLQRDLRVHRVPAVGLAAAPFLGFLFGLGWTPCIGPTLAAVQTLAIDSASAGRGALLSAFYCLGLGLPFLLVALAFRRAFGAMAWMKRHYVLLMRIGGGMLVVLGVLMVTGLWQELSIQMRVWTANFGVPF